MVERILSVYPLETSNPEPLLIQSRLLRITVLARALLRGNLVGAGGAGVGVEGGELGVVLLLDGLGAELLLALCSMVSQPSFASTMIWC